MSRIGSALFFLAICSICVIGAFWYINRQLVTDITFTARSEVRGDRDSDSTPDIFGRAPAKHQAFQAVGSNLATGAAGSGAKTTSATYTLSKAEQAKEDWTTANNTKPDEQIQVDGIAETNKVDAKTLQSIESNANVLNAIDKLVIKRDIANGLPNIASLPD